MKFFTPTTYFEQNTDTELPRKVVHIVRNCAARVSSGIYNSRTRELTEAMMLMKLYQAYGYDSRRYTDRALKLLRSLLDGGPDKIRPESLTQPA